MNRLTHYLLGILTGVVVTLSSFFLTNLFYIKQEIFPQPIETASTGFDLSEVDSALHEVYDIIQTHYYHTGDIDQSRMSRQAISSFVNALGDPFSSYLEPVENKELNDALDGTQIIEGIGAYLAKKDAGVVIEEVIKSSPAAQGGLQSMDIIVKVDGSGVQNLTLSEVVDKIRGPQGTSVDLSLVRSGTGGIELLEKTIIRDSISIPSVSAKIFTVSGKNIGYLSLSIFGEDTNRRIIKEIGEFEKNKISGLVLDLRGNGGGLLPEAVTIASHFLPKGVPVVSAKYRLYNDELYRSEGTHDLDLPLVILVDGMTASASEILTLALKENSEDVVVLGTKTFGKGSIQTLQPVRFGGSLKLTVGKWFSPLGVSVDGVGIVPDIELEFDVDAYQKHNTDNQLEKAKDILLEKVSTS